MYPQIKTRKKCLQRGVAKTAISCPQVAQACSLQVSIFLYTTSCYNKKNQSEPVFQCSLQLSLKWLPLCYFPNDAKINSRQLKNQAQRTVLSFPRTTQQCACTHIPSTAASNVISPLIGSEVGGTLTWELFWGLSIHTSSPPRGNLSQLRLSGHHE